MSKLIELGIDLGVSLLILIPITLFFLDLFSKMHMMGV